MLLPAVQKPAYAFLKVLVKLAKLQGNTYLTGSYINLLRIVSAAPWKECAAYRLKSVSELTVRS